MLSRAFVKRLRPNILSQAYSLQFLRYSPPKYATDLSQKLLLSASVTSVFSLSLIVSRQFIPALSLQPLHLQAPRQPTYQRYGPIKNNVNIQPKPFLQKLYFAIKVGARCLFLGFLITPVLLFAPFAYFFPNRFLNRWWSMLKSRIEVSGSCWIKLGQWVSTRPDIFPPELCQQFTTFHSACPTHSWAETKAILESEFGEPVEVLFRDFDTNPIASGAIAQVYKATLRSTGTPVAVKVQHPYVERAVLYDLAIMKTVAWLIDSLPGMKWYSLPDSTAQFEKTMLLQLHLDVEASNLLRFHSNFSSDRRVVFPSPYGGTEKVLIESFEVGTPLIHYFSENTAEKMKFRIADVAMDLYIQMLLMDNFVHTDLHPGNIFVREDPSGDPKKVSLVFLDCGLVTELTPELRKMFLVLFTAIVSGDGERAAESMIESTRYTEIKPEEVVLFKAEMAALFSRLHTARLADIQVGQTLTDVLNTVRKYRVKIEGNFASLVVATVLLEGVAKQLNPSLGLIAIARPALKSLIRAGGS